MSGIYLGGVLDERKSDTLNGVLDEMRPAMQHFSEKVEDEGRKGKMSHSVPLQHLLSPIRYADGR